MSAASAIVKWCGEGRVLVASSRADVRLRILGEFPSAGQASEAKGGADALIQLAGDDFRMLLIDPHLEDLNVEELIETIHSRYPHVRIVMMEEEEGSASPRFDEPARQGEFIEEHSSETEGSSLAWDTQSELFAMEPKPPPLAIEPLPGMIGTSNKMQQLYRLARLVAPHDTTVLIVGGTGTGKELVAHGIHEMSRRSRGPFVVVNCAAIPESLLEAELFGVTRGAFTGAFQSRLGRIHSAHGGTLLLDEVGELALGMQSKLLRFVQEGEVQRLGSADLFRVDTRIVAATNTDLLQRVREKQFREDLYYRLAVFPLELPPLRNRPEDIIPLAQHFLIALCRNASVPRKSFSPESVVLLRKYSWPGNVRELQHGIERAFILAESNGQIRPGDFSITADAP
jgi:transcriptional regulator with GAF, ATPase, and Fis domain